MTHQCGKRIGEAGQQLQRLFDAGEIRILPRGSSTRNVGAAAAGERPASATCSISGRSSRAALKPPHRLVRTIT